MLLTNLSNIKKFVMVSLIPYRAWSWWFLPNQL